MNRKTLEKRLDKLWASGKEKAKCEICLTLPPNQRVRYTQVHPHHLIPRTHKATRWHPFNRLWLCPTHHTLGSLSAHKNPIWFAEWLKLNRPKIYEWVCENQYINKHWSLEELENLISAYQSSKDDKV